MSNYGNYRRRDDTRGGEEEDEMNMYRSEYEELDPYRDMEYGEYDRNESYDMQYYDNQENEYVDGGRYTTDGRDRSEYADYANNSRRRRGNRGRSRDSDNDSVSDGGFSIRSSLVRTPASHGSAQDIDIFGAYRVKGGEAGRPTGSVTSFSRSASWVSNQGQSGFDFAQAEMILNESPYPSWSDPNQIPLSKEEIEDIFKDLTHRLGFQQDSMRNLYDMMMMLLDSRASRMSPAMALLTLHSDYIGGEHSNYRKWYFSAQLDRDLPASRDKSNNRRQHQEALAEEVTGENDTLAGFEENWRATMNSLSQYERARQIALWLLIWGEAGNLRFCSELLAFIFKIAEDYYRSPACQQKVEPEVEGYYLQNIVKPVYNYLRGESYLVIKGKQFKREKDHDTTIGYDDINETFWTPEGLKMLVTSDKTRFMDIPPEQRWHRFKDISFPKSIEKTYKEKRTVMHFVTNFSRVWIMHVVVYYYYIIFVANFLYDPSFELRDSNNPNRIVDNKEIKMPDVTPRRFSLIAAGGALAPLIGIAATLAEMGYVKATRSNIKVLILRIIVFVFFFVVDLAPTYICWIYGLDPTFNHLTEDEAREAVGDSETISNVYKFRFTKKDPSEKLSRVGQPYFYHQLSATEKVIKGHFAGAMVCYFSV
ncbi:1,3-beta-glucan synthase component FKS1 [Zancudomyces culisetae]|uniref:1,3-beta-glucan synthase component FKS1 n=1 Tax=Zancudomyces culisetae TaxID=1213189 RepID=A0A1R1PWE4_ZANCU|nr:1,3-beta-glucan synthase component FKS1 [Zancudomyces culisetae]|eukprot:OMH85290.1 1,3-beta-glucan synthase component FKS1 [Zancudomyces culisetae]